MDAEWTGKKRQRMMATCEGGENNWGVPQGMDAQVPPAVGFFYDDSDQALVLFWYYYVLLL